MYIKHEISVVNIEKLQIPNHLNKFIEPKHVKITAIIQNLFHMI
jgi:hypothetical protein